MRKAQNAKRKILGDRKYDLSSMSKMINKIMWNGKKTVAEKIFYTALEKSAKESGKTPVEFFNIVLENVGPKKIIVLRRFGGSTYSVPKELKTELRADKAISLIVNSMRTEAYKQGKKAVLVLENIFTQSFNKTGPAINAKEEIHKTAKANEAFAHFAW